MSQWRIDSDATRFHISMEPGLPGVGVDVHGITGSFEATLGDDGLPRLDAPMTGEFAMTVSDLELGNALLTGAVRRWLGGDDRVAVSGRLGEIADLGDERYRVVMGVDMRGRRHRFEGRGHTSLTDAGHLRVVGRTHVDPRAIGIPLPPLVRIRSIADWDIALVPS